MKLKAALFDFDGTLGDTLALCLKAAHLAVEPLLGRAVSDSEILATFGPSEEGAFRKLVPPEIYDSALSAYVSRCRDLLLEFPELFPGIRELLHDLKKRGLILGLVTGRGRLTCDDALKFYGIFDLFDQIEVGEEAGPNKPKCFARILNRFQLNPLETVYVGDSPSDIWACRETGIPVLAAAWASTASAEELAEHSPDRIFLKVEELQKWFTEVLEKP